MPKKSLGLAVLLLVSLVLISGCGKKTNNQSNVNQNQDQNQGATAVNPSGEYTINELLTMNKPLKCSWKESVTNGGDVTNILYVSGKKFYQDVTMGDLGHAYTISDGEYLYIWNNFTNVASKMNIKEAEAYGNSNSNSGQAQANVGQEQKHDFVCENWTVDNSVFVPPQDKNFKDITEEMGKAVGELQGNSENYKQQACAMCDQSPTQQLKDDCRKNLGCV